MTVPPEQAEAVGVPAAARGAAPIETHISLVFVGADTVWKLSKAVRLSFLDFTAAETRRRFAFRELELNAPPAPGLYRDVVPVVRRTDGSLALRRTEGPAIDWVLRMARVPSRALPGAHRASGGLDPELLDAIGDCVAAYHLALAARGEADTGEAMRHRRMGKRTVRTGGRPARAGRARLARSQSWPAWTCCATGCAHAARDGFVRRAHGDLHLGNLCLWHGRPVLFDALEFDEAMATHRSRLRPCLPADGHRPPRRPGGRRTACSIATSRAPETPRSREACRCSCRCAR